MHNWQVGDLAKCIDPEITPDNNEVRLNGEYIVKHLQREACEEHGSHLYLGFVGCYYEYVAESFVPVVPTKEEPKRVIKLLTHQKEKENA